MKAPNNNAAVPDNNTKSGTARINFIDLARGIAMFIVVWSHSTAPPDRETWDIGISAVILFFFISGIFFRPTSLRDFITKKSRTLLVPSALFFLIYIPFRIAEHYWDFRDILTFDWTALADPFRITPETLYIRINAALWFLLTLFMIEAISQILLRLPQPLVLTTIIISLVFRDTILSWPTIFMFNKALYWYIYFAAGWLMRPFIINLIEKSIRFRVAAYMIITGILLTLIILLTQGIIADIHDILTQTTLVLFSLSILILSSISDILIQLPALAWIGRHTLEILCMHKLVLIPLNRIYDKFYGSEYILIGMCLTIFTLLILFPAIRYLNRTAPWIFGKKRKTNQSSIRKRFAYVAQNH